MVRTVVTNDVIQDAHAVWVLKDQAEFEYSEGRYAEQYLERAFENATDLSSRSEELQRLITDWRSEYHLSLKRAQLLSGFSFDRAAKVLEVGCGCGAITRYLGEVFDDVIGVEGSINRARLARARTRDLEGVSIICAPFQELRFTRQFDLIVCVGVFEYSASFVKGDDPYGAVLRYFRDLLTPDGIVLIAIENQFGLKYLGGLSEDHLGVRFAGVEGYHSSPTKVRTFGRAELQQLLANHFPSIRFYYPYPDYKVPDCVVSEEFLGDRRSGEVISQMHSRDYGNRARLHWNEGLVALELSRNHLLPSLANSFLVLAGKGSLDKVHFDQLAVLYSRDRLTPYSACTRVWGRAGGEWSVDKRRLAEGADGADGGATAVRLLNGVSPWVDGLSLQSVLLQQSQASPLTIAALFAPARPWVHWLEAHSTIRDGVRVLSGEFIDCIWSNVYVSGGECTFVDREWHWHEDIPLSVLVARAIYVFLERAENYRGVNRSLRARSGGKLIRTIGATLGVRIRHQDLTRFVALESEFKSVVSGVGRPRHAARLRWYLADRWSMQVAYAARNLLRRLGEKVKVTTVRVYNRLVPSRQPEVPRP